MVMFLFIHWNFIFLYSVYFSCPVVSDSLWPHESQHSRPPCPSPTPRVHSKLMSIESIMPSSHLILCRPLLLLPPNPSQHQSFPVSQLFTSGGQNIGVSALASVLPVNTQDWSPLEWTGWISLRVKWKEEESTKNWVMKYSQSREMRNHLSGPDWSEYLVYWILLSYWETGLSVKLIDVIAFELFILVWLWTF